MFKLPGEPEIHWSAGTTLAKAKRVIDQFKARRARFQQRLARGKVRPDDKDRQTLDVRISVRILDMNDNKRVVHTETIG